MRSGNQTLNWNTPMFGATQRHHFDTKHGDNIGAITNVSNDPPGRDGIKAMDGNFQVFYDVALRVYEIFMLHWETPGPNGYDRYVGADGKEHMMNPFQLHRPGDQWGRAGVLSWRRPNGERPITYAEAVKHAAHVGVVITAELKSRRFISPSIAMRMVDVCKAVGHPAWFMALESMRDYRGKCEAIEGAGGQFALIFGRFKARKPADWNQWKYHPSQIWGPAYARLWLRDTHTGSGHTPVVVPVRHRPHPPVARPWARRTRRWIRSHRPLWRKILSWRRKHPRRGR